MEATMIHTLTVLGALALAGAAHAQYEYNQLTPQQARIKACDTEATGKHLKGKDRSHFMNDCLHASRAASASAGSGLLKR